MRWACPASVRWWRSPLLHAGRLQGHERSAEKRRALHRTAGHERQHRLGAFRALADAGLRVPEDVSVISCDQFYSAEYLVPRLTSVDQHNEQFGRFIINALLGAMRGVQENVVLTFTPELVIRESCAPAPASR